uniref:Uncharacterized protein n=1 Tax=Globodera rostochiensis TaxID=31243 RepID=A0A914GSJ8_GLORO
MIKHNAKRQSNYRIMKWWGKIVVLMNQLLSPSRVLFAKLGTSGSHQLNHCALLSCSKRLGAFEFDKIEQARSREGKLRHAKGDDGKQPTEFDQLTHTEQDKLGTHAWCYCGQRFYNVHSTGGLGHCAHAIQV